MSKIKVVKGVLENYAETGTGGFYWSVQDENHIDDKGMYSYDGLNILSPRTLQHMTIYDMDGEEIYSDNPLLISHHLVNKLGRSNN